MSTIVQRYINNTDGNTSGGDGTTNATSGPNRAFVNWTDAKTAIYAEYPNFVSANVQVNVDVTGLISHTSLIAFDGFVGDATHFLRVRAASGQQHAGYYDTSKAGFITSGGTSTIYPVQSYTRFENLQIVNATSSTTWGTAFQESGSADVLGLVISGCVIHRTGRSGTAVSGGEVYQYGGIVMRDIVFANNVISGSWFRGIDLQYTSAGSSIVVYNNTIIAPTGTTYESPVGTPFTTYAIDIPNVPAGSFYIKNNRVEAVGNGGCYNLGSNAQITSTNFSSDATSPDGAAYRSKTGTYTDATNFIYTLQSTDAGIDQGTSLAADAKYSFSTDIKGTTRSGSWEIGAFDAASYLVVQRYINAASSGGNGTTNATSGANAAYASFRTAIPAISTAYPNFTISNIQMNVDVTGLSETTGGDNWLTTYPITQDATRYLQFQAATGQRHSGKYNISKAGFKDQFQQGFVLYEIPSYTRFDGLQFVIPDTLDQGTAVYNTAGQQGIYITNCVIHRYGRSAAATQGKCMEWSGIQPKGLVFVNNVISGSWYTGVFIPYALGAGSNVVIYNNTIKLDAVASGTNYGFYLGSGWDNNSLWLKNNRVEGPAICYALNGTQTTATNMSSDTTSPQTGLRSLTGTFTNAGAYDLSLAIGDAGIDQGTSLVTDASGKYSFTTDIAGTTRGATWEIGAFDYTLVPTTTTTSTTAAPTTTTTAAPTTSTTTAAPTTYPSAAVFDASTDRINFGSGTLFDLSTFTTAVLIKPAIGGTRGNYLGRGSSWELNIDPSNGTVYAKWYGTSTQDDGVGSCITAGSWNWVWVTWNGTSFGVRTGLYGGTVSTRTVTNNNVGSGLNSQVGKTLNAGMDPVSHDGLYTNNMAFAGIWSGVLSAGTIDSYSANMTASGGLAAAIEYWKWAATDTTSITGGKASTPGTYSSITLNSGPDAAVTTTTTTIAATTTTTTVSGSTTTTTLAPARIRAWMMF